MSKARSLAEISRYHVFCRTSFFGMIDVLGDAVGWNKTWWDTSWLQCCCAGEHEKGKQRVPPCLNPLGCRTNVCSLQGVCQSGFDLHRPRHGVQHLILQDYGVCPNNMIQHDLSYHSAFLACLLKHVFDIVDPSCLNQIPIVPWVKYIQRLVKIPPGRLWWKNRRPRRHLGGAKREGGTFKSNLIGAS